MSARSADGLHPFPSDLPQPPGLGGKAASLWRLSAAGLPVPPGVVLGAGFFAPWDAQLQALPPDAAGAAAAALDWDAAQRQTLERLRALLDAAPGARFAVRSSALDEDSAAASFAGIFETRLGVPLAGLEAAIRACYAAAWSPRVQAYRAERGLARATGPGLALVLQQQLDSELAGVGFSVNPLNNDHDEALFAANWGLGSTVVDGRVNPDQYRLCKLSGRLLEAQRGDKRFIERLGVAAGVETAPSHRAAEFCLDAGRLAQLLGLLQRSERLFGQPVDIEWAFAHGRPWLLQARPITTCLPLPALLQTRAGERRRLYLDAALSKGMTSNRAFSPLGQDQLELAFRTLVSSWWGPLAALERVDAPLVFAGGRMYLNLSELLWLCSPAQLAKGHAATDSLTAELLAGIDRAQYRALRRPHWLRLGLLARLPRLLWRLRALFGHLALAALAPQALKRRYDRRLASLQGELLDLLERVRQGQEPRALGPLIEALSLRLGRDAGLLLAALVAGQLTPAWVLGRHARGREQELQALKRGAGGNLVVEMGAALQQLSRQLGAPAFADLDELERRLQARTLPAPVLQAWDDFLRRYGWRGPDEMDIASPRYGDSPGLALRQMAGMVTGFDLQQALQTGQQQRQLALARLAAPLGPLRRGLLRRLNRIGELFAGTRDTPKHLNVLANFIAREQALRQGRALVAAGRLDHPEQVYALRLADLDAAASQPGLDLRALSKQRSALVHRLNALRRNFPPLIDSRGRILNAAARAQAAGQLRGMPIAPGRVRGPVRRLLQADGARIQPGEILVAYTTDPGWTPLFVNAGAVLLEVGGALQHGAVLAREFGKPCVAGLAQVLEQLHDGEWVEVDGAAGTVSRCSAVGDAAAQALAGLAFRAGSR